MCHLNGISNSDSGPLCSKTLLVSKQETSLRWLVKQDAFFLITSGKWGGGGGKLFLSRNKLTLFKPVILLSESIMHFKKEVRILLKKKFPPLFRASLPSGRNGGLTPSQKDCWVVNQGLFLPYGEGLEFFLHQPGCKSKKMLVICTDHLSRGVQSFSADKME